MGSCERRIAREELEIDIDCSASDKARRMADFSPPTSLEYRVKHYSIESTIEYSIVENFL